MIADLIAIKPPWTAEDFEKTGTPPEEVFSYILAKHPELTETAINIIERLLKEQEVKA